MRYSALVICLLLAACVSPPVTTNLGEVEVREYQGERLGSVRDFRENSIKGVQYVNISTYNLKIDGLVNSPKSYSYEEVLSKPAYSKVVLIDCVEGWRVNALWKGVLLSDLFKDAGVNETANTVKFYSVDGYTTTLPLSYIRDKNIILAYQINNITLPPQQGFPFIVVAESKWGYKWARWVNRIELTDNPDEEGFWEQRGYNQQGDVSGPILER